ncbi:N-acetylmuramoyl-L-alanine amidase [Pseudomonas sp. F1_0610]|uniref:N-acetylmuramoyl-L-alanine amidase n=1 Tax=Pseudomonas sp. F1_0610 TaxID=3114284 RepID=UPI0039C3C127
MRLGSHLIIFLLALMPVQLWAASQIQSVRLWRAPDNTRLVFDLSGPVDHSVFMLEGPARVVIDVKNAKLNTTLTKLALQNTPISNVRSGPQPNNQLRIVLDMKAKVVTKSFTLAPNQQYGHRLVVDLFDSASAASATTTSTPPATASSKPATNKPPEINVSRPPTVMQKGQRDIVIAIDAGHGGEDPGALGPKGLREKDVVLQIAKELQRQINAQKGFRAELTRTGDYFIPLRKRTEIARKKGADLFVSIHADAAPRAAAFGGSVFALSDRGATSETARWLADSENRSDLIGGAGNVTLDDKDKVLASVLLDLSMTATMSSSLDVGQKVLNQMGKITPLHKRRVEQAGFMVLKSPDIPSILVETGFISNPNESRKLSTAAHQKALAKAITGGITQFFHETPPPGTYIAWLRDNGKITFGAREHTVRSGESVSIIANRYGVSTADIRSANSLKTDVLKIGQTLKIPATTASK